jgi:hypothetical protein
MGRFAYSNRPEQLRALIEEKAAIADLAYVYIAYASDDSGTGYTETFDPDLDYVAILRSETAIATRDKDDFSGLWKHVGAGAAGVASPLIVAINVGSTYAMTDANPGGGNPERFAANSTRAIVKLDLAAYTQVRATTRVVMTSASANTPKIRFRYYTSWSTTVGDYLQFGASAHVDLSVASATYVDTGWLDLATGAKADGIYAAMMEVGGDGAADPSVGNTYLWFR